MSLSSIELGGRRAVRLCIDGCASLTDALVSSINAACDHLEEGGDGGSILLLQIQGRSRIDATVMWPGSVDLQLVSRWEGALRRIERLAGVSLATANGSCSAGVLELLLAADFRIGKEDLRMHLRLRKGEAPWPGMSLHRLADQVGLSRARSLALFTRELTSEQACEAGILDDVCADERKAIEAFLESVQSMDLTGVLGCRLLLLEAKGQTYEAALGTHLAACDSAIRRRRASVSESGSGAIVSAPDSRRAAE